MRNEFENEELELGLTGQHQVVARFRLSPMMLAEKVGSARTSRRLAFEGGYSPPNRHRSIDAVDSDDERYFGLDPEEYCQYDDYRNRCGFGNRFENFFFW